MKKLNLIIFASLLIASGAAFAQQPDDGLDDFNIPGVDKSLDKLVGPEPEISSAPRVKQPVGQNKVPKLAEPQKAAPKPIAKKVVEPKKLIEVSTPPVLSGIEWVRVVPDRSSLKHVSFEVPVSWKQKKGIWTVKKGDKIETGLKVILTKFKEEDLAIAAKRMPEFSSSKTTINGNVVIVISSKRIIKKVAYTIKMAFYGAPMYRGKKQLMLMFSSANIERDMPIFEHIMQTVKSSQTSTKTANDTPIPTLKGKTIKFVKTALGDGEGAIKIADGYYKTSLTGYKGTNFFAAGIDLNSDGKKEWMVRAKEPANCHSTPPICLIFLFGHGPDGTLIDLGYANFAMASVLKSTTNGYRDLVFDNKLYTYDGKRSYRKGRQPEVIKKLSPTPISKPTQPVETPILPRIEWVRVSIANKDLKGMAFDVPKNWIRSEDSNNWVMKTGSKIEVYLDVSLLRLKGMELARTKAHLEKFKSTTSVINGIPMEILTAENKHGGVLYNENFVFFGEPVPFTQGKITMMFNTSNIKRDGPIFQHILQSVQFYQKPISPKTSSQNALKPDGPVSIDGYSERHIGSLSFSLPSEWQKDDAKSNIVSTVYSAGDFSLQIFQITGFHPLRNMVDKLVSTSLAGRKAKRYEYDWKSARDVVLELDNVNSQGKRLSFTFTAPQKSWPAFQPVFERIVSSIRFGGSTSGLKRPPATTQTVAPAPASTAKNWKTYTNPRFGTSIDYPAFLFEALPPPENGDGRTFKSKDGRAEFLIFGSHNALEQTVKELFADQLMSDTYEAILEKALQNNEYFLKARSNGKIIAQKVILDAAGVFHTFKLSYPEAESAQYDLILKRMVVSFSSVKKAQLAPKSKQAPSQAVELAFWQSINKSTDPADFEAYLAQWPTGTFAVLANNKLRRLRASIAAEVMPIPKKRVLASPRQVAPRRNYYTPARKTRERRAIMNAARIPISKALRQKVIFVVSVLRSDGRWAYLQAVPHRPNGRKLNWSRTPFASDWKNDAMSEVVMVLLRKDGRRWKAVNYVIGPTDVHWIGWLDQYGLPKALFSAR